MCLQIKIVHFFLLICSLWALGIEREYCKQFFWLSALKLHIAKPTLCNQIAQTTPFNTFFWAAFASLLTHLPHYTSKFKLSIFIKTFSIGNGKNCTCMGKANMAKLLALHKSQVTISCKWQVGSRRRNSPCDWRRCVKYSEYRKIRHTENSSNHYLLCVYIENWCITTDVCVYVCIYVCVLVCLWLMQAISNMAYA